MTVIEMPHLTLHRGGAHSDELIRLVEDAEHAMQALEDALPHDDFLRGPVGNMTAALGCRHDRMSFQRDRKRPHEGDDA